MTDDPIRILIVEDSIYQLEHLAGELRGLGYKIETSVNGEEALKAVAEFQPDLVIADIEMPVMDGLQLCETLKSVPETRNIPVVLMTAHEDVSDILDGMNVGADSYITKPYNLELLAQSIGPLLERVETGLLNFTEDAEPLILNYQGNVHTVTANRSKILNLFISAYQNTLIQNHLLIEKEQYLVNLNDKLTQTVDRLSASEERFRGLVQTIPDIVYKIDADGCFTFLNDSIKRLGYHQVELLGKHFSEIIYSNDVEDVTASTVIAKLRESGKGKDAKETDEATTAKLFDERRGTDRMTVGLRLRLKTKTGGDPQVVEVESIGNELIFVEINSIGMYGDRLDLGRQYIGTVGVMRDIDDRVKSEQEMIKAREIADAANKAKSDFLASMSHELRTPLNAILGFGQMLEFNDKEPLSEGQKDCVTHIMKGGQHLLELINEILDLAKIEAGKVELHIDDVCVKDVFDECLSFVQKMADERSIKIGFDSHFQATARVRADRIRFLQSLLNLLSNAVKYNREKGKVTLCCDQTDDGFFRISVADTGEGIPEDNLKELFEPFNRLKSNQNVVEGTGIGLTITRHLIERMGGQIGVNSEVGKGSTFWIDLPQVVQ